MPKSAPVRKDQGLMPSGKKPEAKKKPKKKK